MTTSIIFRKLLGAALALTVIGNAGLLPVTLTAAASAQGSAQYSVATAETVYVVRAGDTLSAIAKRYGVTVNALMGYNQLTATTIFIGQRLLIPTQSAPAANPIRYLVQRGDTLSALAQRYGTTVAALMQLNNLPSSAIRVGQTLLIAASQTPPSTYIERIQFGAGAISATVRGTVQETEEHQYTLRALAGQTMTVKATARDAGLLLEIKGVSDGVIYKQIGEAFIGDLGNWSGLLPTTQDYLLTVALGLSTGHQANYALTVTIPPETTQPVPPTPRRPTEQRIQFAPGTSGATVFGTVEGSSYARYLLGAQAGQTMWVNLTPDSTMLIISPSGQLLGGGSGPTQSWSGPLPENGDYIIEVTAVGLATDYSLAVAIQ